jgi:hypothetical protein
LEAWLPSTSNYDLALLRWAFATATELAEELGYDDDAARWHAALATLRDFSHGEDERLLVAPEMSLRDSHRHFSHLVAIPSAGTHYLRGW